MNQFSERNGMDSFYFATFYLLGLFALSALPVETNKLKFRRNKT